MVATDGPRVALPRWLLVAGSVQRWGATDYANAALVDYLAAQGATVHVVAHTIGDEYAADPRVVVHQVPAPLGSPFVAEWPLRRRAWAVFSELSTRGRGPRVVANGGNFPCRGTNWVHSVHHAWPVSDAGAPASFRAKHRIAKYVARRDERRALRAARLVIANSERTRRDVIDHLGVPAERVHRVYLGAGVEWAPPLDAERAAARAAFGVPDERPLVVFVGALSHDHNKGFDTLWAAWQALVADAGWDADLIVAGDGRGRPRWEAEAARAGLAERVQFLGYTNRVAALLAAADLLVSPVRYEAYGLNVQEAICRGVPALVSATAGVAERYPRELGDLLLADPSDARALAAALRRWRADPARWRARVAPFGAALRAHTWSDMARELVARIDAAEAQSPDLVTGGRR